MRNKDEADIWIILLKVSIMMLFAGALMPEIPVLGTELSTIFIWTSWVLMLISAIGVVIQFNARRKHAQSKVKAS